MKRFQFPLERVLDFRRMQAETERLRLDEILARRAAVQANQERLAEDRKKQLALRSMEPVEMAARESYLAFLRRERQRLDAQLAEIDQLAAAQRMKVIEADRRRDLLEKLKERKRSEWSQAEQRELEELAADSFRARLHAARRVRV